jgi:hypothetical protein
MAANKRGIEVRVVRTWEELQREVFVDSFSPSLQRYRSAYAFRVEKVMFRNFRKYAYANADPAASDWKWLALAQHHGLPTRLLDWTYSPLVAMHFATNELDKMDKDGVIWMANFVNAAGFLPPPMAKTLHDHAAYSFSVEMLEKDFPVISSVEQLKGDHPAFVAFFEPPSLDPFLNRPDVLLHEWLHLASTQLPGLARKLVIPAKLKWEIRDKLDNMNITERVIMPGLDGLTAWLKRWYSPKSTHPVAAPAPPRHASRSAAPGVSSATRRQPSSKRSRRIVTTGRRARTATRM